MYEMRAEKARAAGNQCCRRYLLDDGRVLLRALLGHDLRGPFLWRCLGHLKLWSQYRERRERGHPVRQRAQPAPAFRLPEFFSKEFALRAQADRMSA
ncbi:MAG: hypothetical protein QOG23_2198, partial [Blastocatellia bacterium]|nr:hypothetical protein [Blastocatellia bacterium]